MLRRLALTATRCLAAPVRSAAAVPARVLLAAPPALARSSALRGFAASSQRGSLASALAAELSHEKKEYETPELVKQGPPEPWTLSDEEGAAELVRQLSWRRWPGGADRLRQALVREFGKGEEITVTVNVDQPAEDEDDWDLQEGEEEGAGGDGEEEEEEEESVTVLFDVRVAKPEGSALVFECATDGVSVDILHVTLDDAEAPTLDEGYGGPAFSDLDAGLQEAFEAYLEERGVDAALAEYVVELSIDKEQREYVHWLKRTAAFVKA